MIKANKASLSILKIITTTAVIMCFSTIAVISFNVNASQDNEILVKEVIKINKEQLLNKYIEVKEKIVKETVEIPYETITKDATNSGAEGINKVIQEGQNGIKEITAKIIYQNEIEIEKIVLEEKITVEVVNKIVEISKKAVISSRSSTTRTVVATTEMAQKVEGITPIVTTVNASAYTASTCGKQPGDSGYGITASGARATSYYTIAAGKSYPIGTIVYIPQYANKANGGWFVVQDRGGAISDNRLDIYMDTYEECISFGRKNIECYIYVK